MWSKLSKSYPPQIELLPLFLVLVGFYLALSAYPSLPERVPVHFDYRGVPDGWGDKGSIIGMPIANAVIYLLLTVVGALLTVTKDPRRFINLPARRKAALTDAQVEVLRVFLSRGLFALKNLILLLMVYSIHITIEVAFGRAEGLDSYWFLFIIAILVVVGLMVWKSYRITGSGKTLSSLP